jgi:hypothetical protein
MARSSLMEDREVWIQAGAILAAHGELTVDYIIDQLSGALGSRIALEDWRRIAAAVDVISEARPQ